MKNVINAFKCHSSHSTYIYIYIYISLGIFSSSIIFLRTLYFLNIHLNFPSTKKEEHKLWDSGSHFRISLSLKNMLCPINIFANSIILNPSHLKSLKIKPCPAPLISEKKTHYISKSSNTSLNLYYLPFISPWWLRCSSLIYLNACYIRVLWNFKMA